jgi:hypothetical protein
MIHRLRNDLPRAMAAYDRALALDPNLISASAARGLAHEAKGDINSAKRDFQAALNIAAGAVVKSGVGGGTTYFDAGSHRYHEIARARLAVLNAAHDAAPAPPARADAGGDRRVALVIGNGAYRSAGALANPANDAAAIAKNLKAMGFEVSSGIDLDRAGLTRLIGDFLRSATNARIAVLFYTGHGVQIDGKNYLLPVDARIENGTELTADMTDLDTILAGLDDQVRTNIVILDACRDNPSAKTVTQVAGVARSVAVRSGLAAPSVSARARRWAPARCSPLRPRPAKWRSTARVTTRRSRPRSRGISARRASRCSRCSPACAPKWSPRPPASRCRGRTRRCSARCFWSAASRKLPRKRRGRRHHRIIVFGITSAICGNAIRIAMHTIIANQNGRMPLKMSVSGTSGTSPLTMNTLMPTGGSISPISSTITMITPNQIRS